LIVKKMIVNWFWEVYYQKTIRLGCTHEEGLRKSRIPFSRNEWMRNKMGLNFSSPGVPQILIMF
jgi:hypothetical protein